MMRFKNLLTGMLAVLAVLLLTGCWEKDNPSRTSLDVDTSTLTLSVGETAVRMATSKAEDAAITYTSSNPAVATVDQFGKVTALTEGETTITIDMAETKKSWYAAKTLTYSVVVKNVSAQALANVDKATPLTLVAQADGKITVTFNNGITLANDIKYTINNGAEQTIAKNTSGSFDIEVKKGDVVQFYSLNTSLGGGAVAGARGTTRAVDSSAKYINIRPSMKTEIYGNVMSLLKGKDNLESATALEAKNAFYGLFAGAEKLVNNAERLLVLPATTLTEGCYQDMFNGCKGIEKAPELPAPKLEKNCYQEMFYDCAKLNSVTCLATDIKAENSTKDWLGKAGTEASTKTLTTLVDMTPNSDDGVPASWTAQKAVESVTLGKTELALVVNEADVTLTATVKPDDASDKTVTWTSSNPAVATVDANGTVHAVAAGEATITATAGDKTATCKVTVSAKPAATVTTAPTATASVTAGSTTALVNAGVTSDGEMQYKVTTTNTKPTTTDGFSATVPTAQSLAAGTCYVWYYVKADDTHVDSEIAGPVEITVAKPAATVTTAPTANTGVKAGEDKAIINAGVASGGTMMYALTTTNKKPTSTLLFGSTVPSAKNRAAGTFYVWYYVKADDTHVDSDIAGPVQVTIASAIISTKDASETFTPTAGTVTGTYFKVSGIKMDNVWEIGGAMNNTITISSPDGLNLSQVVFTVGSQANTNGRNPSHLNVNHGTLTVTGTTPGNTVTISNINSPSVTLSAPGTNNAAKWTFTQAVVDGKGDASK